MQLYIKGGHILDPAADTDRIGDLLIEDGRIVEVFSNAEEEPQIIDASGLYVAPGLIDLHVHLREPGQTHKETIKTGLMAAAAGGFTGICPMPNTVPVIDEAHMVQYELEAAKDAPYAALFPIGAITLGQKGQALCDYESLKKAGAVALSEDGKSVADAALMKSAFERAKALDIPIFDHCEDPAFAKDDSRRAENEMTRRELELSLETGARLHLCHVSTKEAVSYLEEAREEAKKSQKPLPTGEVCPHHFWFTRKDLEEGGPNFKMNPPLRDEEDIRALKEALRKGIITCISTDHAPHAPEEKEKVESAANGIVGMESAFGAAYTALVEGGVFSLMELIACMSTNPARVLGLPLGSLQAGARADVVLFDTRESYTVDKESFYSKGRNCPFHGCTFKGRIAATIFGGRLVYQREEGIIHD